MEPHDLPGDFQQYRTLLEVSESICAHRDLNVGVRTTLDVLDARYDYLLGRLHLPAAIGQLTEGEVTAVNVYLQGEGSN